MIDVREEAVSVGLYELRIVRPREPEELIDEEAFARDEFLPYWAELWPSAVALAAAVAARPPRGLRVLELGCGLALPSIVAALCGAARVLATDWSADALEFAARNAELNGVAVETALADWRTPDPALTDTSWDLVLASDVLYEQRNAEPLLALLPRLTHEVLLAEPGRPYARPFFDAVAADWTVEPLPDRLYRLTRRFG